MPARPWRALQWARRSFFRPDRPLPAHLGARALPLRQCAGRFPVPRVPVQSSGSGQRPGPGETRNRRWHPTRGPCPRRLRSVASPDGPQSCLAGPAARAAWITRKSAGSGKSGVGGAPIAVAWSSTPNPNPATDGAASAIASASITPRGSSINGTRGTACPAKVAARAVVAGDAFGRTMMPASAPTAAMSLLPRRCRDSRARRSEFHRLRAVRWHRPVLRGRRPCGPVAPPPQGRTRRRPPAPARASDPAILQDRDKEEQPPHQITPLSRSAAIPSDESPMSARMSLVCSPNAGAGPRTLAGVSDRRGNGACTGNSQISGSP